MVLRTEAQRPQRWFHHEGTKDTKATKKNIKKRVIDSDSLCGLCDLCAFVVRLFSVASVPLFSID
jgi:hypothetical protein